MKTCPGCGRHLPLECFHLRTSSPDGHQTRCRTCHNVTQRDGKRRRAAARRELARQRAEAYTNDGRYVVATTSGYGDAGGRRFTTEAAVLDRVYSHRVIRRFVSANGQRAIARARALAYELNANA